MKKIELDNIDIHRFGTELVIDGILMQHGGESYILKLPGGDIINPEKLYEITPSLSQWEQIIQQLDQVEVQLLDRSKEPKLQKIWVRKSTRQISKNVSWEVFRRDNYTCRYCGANDVPLTVDHIVLWEEMGDSVVDNLNTSCSRCNRERGNMQYLDWLNSPYYIGKVPTDFVAENRKRWDVANATKRRINKRSKR